MNLREQIEKEINNKVMIKLASQKVELGLIDDLDKALEKLIGVPAFLLFVFIVSFNEGKAFSSFTDATSFFGADFLVVAFAADSRLRLRMEGGMYVAGIFGLLLY